MGDELVASVAARVAPERGVLRAAALLIDAVTDHPESAIRSLMLRIGCYTASQSLAAATAQYPR